MIYPFKLRSFLANRIKSILGLKGDIKAPDVDTFCKRYCEFMKDQVILTDNNPLEIIGHQLGDFRHYPLNCNKLSHCYDIRQMMDTAFNIFNLTGIELDVQLRYDGVICVMHDELPEQTAPIAEPYTSNNTLEGALLHLFEQETFQDKTMYIEIKCSHHSRLNDKEKKTINSLSTLIHNLANSNKTQKCHLKKQVKFISFNLSALNYLNTCSAHFPLDTIYIAVTDTWLLQLLHLLPGRFMESYGLFNGTMMNKLVTNTTLTGIWFDPLGIKNFAQKFNRINEEREKHTPPLPPLDIGISTYKLSWDNFKKRFTNQGNRQLQNVSGLIVNIDTKRNR
ncbi:MAG: hypothetical protein HQK83_04065 [Fibrobacteria bacterium]|nr:hypothetical protein [Fibrobacteria bacterium]